MRSVLISTDLVMKQDGTWTPTEINTNTSHEMPVKNYDPESPTQFIDNFGDYVNHVELNEFLQANGITTIKTIDIASGFHRVIESFCKYYPAYSYEFNQVGNDSVTVPDVEDGDDVLIIRIAYDSFAVVDDLYARDNYEFHNLIKNESFASSVTFNTGDESNLDTITTFEPSIDGVTPNYLVKRRTPGGTNGRYPILYRLTSQEELDNLKASITSDEFIQKYEFNQSSLVDNRTNFIRSMDLLYGPTLEVFNLLTYKAINSVSTQNNVLIYDVDVDENGALNDLFASKYYPKIIPNHSVNYHFDESDLISMPDGTDLLATDLVLNQLVKSIYFNEEIINYQLSDVSNLTTFNTDSASVTSIKDKTGGIFINMTAVNESGVEYSWYDGLNNHYLLQKADSTTAQYTNTTAGDIEIGDKIFVYNKTTNSIDTLTIQSIMFDIKNIKTYLITLEEGKREFFIKLSDEGDTNEMYLIQHNGGCNEWCGYFYSCENFDKCSDCHKSNTNCPACSPYNVSSFLCNSDRRLKHNIVLIGQSNNGINIYQFNYIDEDGLYEGVIAQELLDTEFQNAVVEGENGMYKVDYSKLDVEFKKLN
jgi:hypothetical protein